MGSNLARDRLLTGINRAFGARNIAATVRRLLPLAANADFLAICNQLELLSPVLRTTLVVYRRELTMPQLSRRIMTAAFRASVQSEPPIPLHLTIQDGEAEAIAVTITPKLISVLLTRTVPAVRPS